MTKDEAKIKLRKEGYNVVDDNSVVTVLIAADVSVSKTVKDVEAKLKALGYEASFAVKQVADGSAIQTDEPDEDAADDVAETAQDQDTEDVAEDTAADGGSDVTEAQAEAEDNADQTEEDDSGYLDEEDSDMLLTEEAVQFSLDDFGLDF